MHPQTLLVALCIGLPLSASAATSWQKVSLDGDTGFTVKALISPHAGANLYSALGANNGYAHTSLTSSPAAPFSGMRTTASIDYGGGAPNILVRVGDDPTGSSGQQIEYSVDSGATWRLHFATAPPSFYGGRIAVESGGLLAVWATANAGVQYSVYGPFAPSKGLPSTGVVVAANRATPDYYAAAGNSFYTTNNYGETFTAAAGTLGASTVANDIVSTPGYSGDVWISTDKGLFHTANRGAAISAIPGFSAAWSISVGATYQGSPTSYSSIFVVGVFNSVAGVYRSDDKGVSWVRLDTDAQQIALPGNVITGDRRIWGRVYVGTSGRGIFYGDEAGQPQVSVSPTSTSTSARSTTSSAPSTATHYGQCGGNGWHGPTICTPPWTCKRQNSSYSQCL